jgi:hypothetical protein
MAQLSPSPLAVKCESGCSCRTPMVVSKTTMCSQPCRLLAARLADSTPSRAMCRCASRSWRQTWRCAPPCRCTWMSIPGRGPSASNKRQQKRGWTTAWPAGGCERKRERYTEMRGHAEGALVPCVVAWKHCSARVVENGLDLAAFSILCTASSYLC